MPDNDNNGTTPPEGLNDNLSDLFGGDVFKDRPLPTAPELVRVREHTPSDYREKCPKCDNGTFRSYTGRPVGRCFACKGQGFTVFKTSPEARAKSRESAKSRAVKMEADNRAHFAAKYPDMDAFLKAKASSWAFAAAMLVVVGKHGELMENQARVIINSMERDAARKAESEARRAAPGAEISINKVAESLNRAFGRGLRKPKLMLGDFVFSRAPDTGRNPGAVYVKAGEDYMGMAVNGQFKRSREATDEQVAKILQVASQPEEAANAYGRLTGNCSCCGRALTAAESVERAIGPICFQKWFVE